MRNARSLALVCVAVVSGAVAQVPTGASDEAGRLVIEVVPVSVVGRGLYFDDEPPPETRTQAITIVRRALSVLGVRPNEYILVVSEEEERLRCPRPTESSEWACTHNTLGRLDGREETWFAFNDTVPPPAARQGCHARVRAPGGVGVVAKVWHERGQRWCMEHRLGPEHNDHDGGWKPQSDHRLYSR